MTTRGLRAAAGAVAFGLATATAAWGTTTAASAAPAPLVIGECDATVQGEPGQPLTLNTSAVVPEAGAGAPDISLGTVEEGTNTVTVPAADIANQVGDTLSSIPLVGGVVDVVRDAVGPVCEITVKGVNQTTSTVQEAGERVRQGAESARKTLEENLPGGDNESGAPEEEDGNSSGNDGGGSDEPAPSSEGADNEPETTLPQPDGSVRGGLDPAELQDFSASFGRAPMRDYSALPFASPGEFSPSPGMRYGGQVPGYTPEFGILGQDGNNRAGQGGQPGQGNGINNAGQAEAIDAPRSNDVAFPVLLGVFTLTAVIAALVRTWVLRRTSG